jgi:hypothetical protein
LKKFLNISRAGLDRGWQETKQGRILKWTEVALPKANTKQAAGQASGSEQKDSRRFQKIFPDFEEQAESRASGSVTAGAYF